jgi:hypothetical protein
MKEQVKKSYENVVKMAREFRSGVINSIYNLLLECKEHQCNFRHIYDYDDNEMVVTKIYINEKDEEQKVFIDFHYLDDEIISEPLNDFPTKTMVEILSKWSRS